MLNAEIRDLRNADGSHTIVGRVWGDYAELTEFYGEYEKRRLQLNTKGTPPIIDWNAVTIVAPSIDSTRDAAPTLRLCLESMGIKTIQVI